MTSMSVLLAADPAHRLTNPYLRIIFGSDAFRRQVEVRAFRPWRTNRRGGDVHLHWPEYLLYGRLARRSGVACEVAYARLVATVDRARAAGGRLIWTAHNLEPHGFPSAHAEAAYRRWAPELIGRVDTVVVMAPSAAAQVRAAFPGLAAARFAEIPHPHYRGYYARPRAAAAVRARYDVPDAAHLTVAAGLVRRYKRLPELMEVFSACACGEEYLLVAGSCGDARLAGEIRARAGSRIRVALGPLDDAGFAEIVAAADLFVGNFEAGLNSGSVLAALSLDTPVLAAGLGALVDLGSQVGEAWLTVFDAPLDAAGLRGHLDRIRMTAPAGSPDLDRNDPGRVAREHLELYTVRSPFRS
jgi:beta-1,4-mannosyltransferase